MASHSRAVRSHTCYFRVDLLRVKTRLDIHGVTLVPTAELAGEGQQPGLAGAPGCVVAVPTEGTDYGRMVQRSRPVAEHAIRVLRATLREHRFMPDEQLRFAVGYDYWFDSGATGWTAEPGQGWALEIDDRLLDEARAVPLFKLGPEPSTEIERRTLLALKWFEQAQLAIDPVLELLFLFSALEAILGSKAEGRKGHGLALRRAMLGLLTSGGFAHPSRTFLLYDQVRSAAVHGEAAPEVSERQVSSFSWDVRRAINEYLQFAQAEGLLKRKRLRERLDTDERRARVLEGLVRDDPENWQRFAEQDAHGIRRPRTG